MTIPISETAVPATACATCGEPLTDDPRFVTWCPACGWNAAPGRTEAVKRGDRFQRRLNREAEERLYRRVAAGRTDGPLPAAAAFLVAGAVHLITLAVLTAGVLALLGPSVLMRCLGVLLLGVAWMLRPRLYTPRRVRRARRELSRDEAPALHALCGRIAAGLGTAAPHVIVVDGRYNASYHRTGLRRRVVLTLGLPLWEVLTPQERVALLGHELGHGANGDSRRALWVGSALTCLDEWYALFRPSHRRALTGGTRSTGGGLAVIGEMVATALFAVLAELTLLLRWSLTRLTALSGRGAEYRADGFGVRVAGRDAAEGMLRALTLGSSADLVRHRRSPAGTRSPRKGGTVPERPAFWDELREYVASIPETERERRLRVSALDDSAVDATHPPTHLRLRHVAAMPPTGPAVLLTAPEVAALEAELAPARARVEADLA